MMSRRVRTDVTTTWHRAWTWCSLFLHTKEQLLQIGPHAKDIKVHQSLTWYLMNGHTSWSQEHMQSILPRSILIILPIPVLVRLSGRPLIPPKGDDVVHHRHFLTSPPASRIWCRATSRRPTNQPPCRRKWAARGRPRLLPIRGQHTRYDPYETEIYWYLKQFYQQIHTMTVYLHVSW